MLKKPWEEVFSPGSRSNYVDENGLLHVRATLKSLPGAGDQHAPKYFGACIDTSLYLSLSIMSYMI